MHIEPVDASSGGLPDDYQAHFSGHAHFQQLTSPFVDGPDLFIVHFAAGGRSRPHLHHSGQVLHVISGTGVVADRGGRHVVRTGDTITVMPDEWHWHGGLPDSAMSHLTVQHRGKDVSWDVDEGDWAMGYETP